jgi:hypothetical protein
VFEKEVLGTVFGIYERGDSRKIERITIIHNWYSLCHNVSMIKMRHIRIGYEACRGSRRNAYILFYRLCASVVRVPGYTDP